MRNPFRRRPKNRALPKVLRVGYHDHDDISPTPPHTVKGSINFRRVPPLLTEVVGRDPQEPVVLVGHIPMFLRRQAQV